MKLRRILCWLGKHDYRKRVRQFAPAIGKEEMRCTVCGDHYLLPDRQPRSRVRFG